jgi:hypothetical protein
MFDVLNYLKAFFIGKFNTFVTIGSLLKKRLVTPWLWYDKLKFFSPRNTADFWETWYAFIFVSGLKCFFSDFNVSW